MSKYCRICRNSNCNNHGRDIVFIGDEWSCNYIPVPTNADHIRNMNDEELAEWLYKFFWGRCKDITPFNIEKWLQQPADKGRCE